MARPRFASWAIITGPVAALVVLPFSRRAEAIPAFAQQTGQPCMACHVGSFGPELTPLGRAFKIGGYTQQGGDGWAADIPLSVMIQSSFTHTAVDQNPAPQHYAPNDNPSLDQVSGFVGGGIGEHTGGFLQFTWSDVDNSVHLDNTDLRPYTTVVDLGGKELRLGTTINTVATVQDPYNSTFAWGFPYIASLLAPTPVGGTLLSSGLGQSALGYTVYAWYDNKLYVEGGFYSTLGPWALGRLGNGYGIGATTSPAPYLRIAYDWQWASSSAHVGALFMHADVSPPSDTYIATADFGHDHYTDYGVDAGYQYLGDGTHIASAQAIMVHEIQNLRGSATAAGIEGSNYSLNELRMNVSYWYQNTYGLTLGWQRSWGPANPVMYAMAGTSSLNDKPNSNAFIIEADWVPFGKPDSVWAPYLNLKLGIQYTAYTQFNGGDSNYDGAGGHASDNNTLLLFAWLMF